LVLTDGDGEIGQAADVDAHLLGALLGDQIDRNRLVPPVVLRESDNQLTHETVLSTIRGLPVNPEDALLFFYAGPGTYDQKGKYYLRLHRGRPMARTDLMDELRKKGARLTVLLTDTCTRPLASDEEEVPLLAQGAEPITLYWLLMANSGVVDIDACSPGERGYYQRAENVAVTPISGETGGSLFMREFFKECRLGESAGKKNLSWREFFDALRKDVAVSFSVATSAAPSPSASGEPPKPQTPHAFQIATQVDKVQEPTQTAATGSSMATLVVRGPAGAAIYLDDHPTTGEGNERTFLTPPLAAGYDYVYQVRVQLPPGWQRPSETRAVIVRPAGRRRSSSTPRPPRSPRGDGPIRRRRFAPTLKRLLS